MFGFHHQPEVHFGDDTKVRPSDDSIGIGIKPMLGNLAGWIICSIRPENALIPVLMTSPISRTA